MSKKRNLARENELRRQRRNSDTAWKNKANAARRHNYQKNKTRDNIKSRLWRLNNPERVKWLNRALSNNGEEFAVDVFRRLIARRDDPG